MICPLVSWVCNKVKLNCTQFTTTAHNRSAVANMIDCTEGPILLLYICLVLVSFLFVSFLTETCCWEREERIRLKVVVEGNEEEGSARLETGTGERADKHNSLITTTKKQVSTLLGLKGRKNKDGKLVCDTPDSHY